MCRFSDASKRKVGNTILYIAQKAKYPYKTEILKLLFLMEERMVQQYHIPFLAIPFSVWRLGPVSIDIFQELSDGPVIFDEYITLQQSDSVVKVLPKKAFDEDEFSDAELSMMKSIMDKYGWMNSSQLIEETHKDGSLWKITALENGLLDDFETKRASSSCISIDMGRQLCPDAKKFYDETLAVRISASKMQI